MNCLYLNTYNIPLLAVFRNDYAKYYILLQILNFQSDFSGENNLVHFYTLKNILFMLY